MNDPEIDALQEGVFESVRSLAVGLRVRSTGYFNNTFIPDGVIEWPDSVDATARPLYLKTSANPAWLTDDVLSADMRPGVFVCLPEVTAAREALQPLQEALRSTGALLVEASTLRAMVALDRGDRWLLKGSGFQRLKLAKA